MAQDPNNGSGWMAGGPETFSQYAFSRWLAWLAVPFVDIGLAVLSGHIPRERTPCSLRAAPRGYEWSEADASEHASIPARTCLT